MANNCSFQMKVIGTRKNIEKLNNYFKAEYYVRNISNQLSKEEEFKKLLQNIKYKCFSDNEKFVFCTEDHYIPATCIDECEIYGEDDDIIEAYFVGDCRWSVYSSMINGYPEQPAEGKANVCIPITEATKLLNLDVEIYSCEPGMAFAEHYVIEKGDIIVDETSEYHEYCDEDFESKEELEKALGRLIPDEEWNSCSIFTKCDLDPHNPYWSI